MAEKLGVDALVATLVSSKDGICTGERVLPEPYGEGKRVLVEKFCVECAVSPEESFAYGDHLSDVPLLEFVGNPGVVNPSRQLKRFALQRRWPVIDLDGAELSLRCCGGRS